MQPLNPGLVNQNFAAGTPRCGVRSARRADPISYSSPAADAIDALHQPTDLGGDIRREIAAFLSYFS
jgi:hypothetical protein